MVGKGGLARVLGALEPVFCLTKERQGVEPGQVPAPGSLWEDTKGLLVCGEPTLLLKAPSSGWFMFSTATFSC